MQNNDQLYVITPSAAPNYVFTCPADPGPPAPAVHMLNNPRLLKEIFGKLPIASIELRHNALTRGTQVKVILYGGSWFYFDLSMHKYYANRSEAGQDTKIPLRYLAEKVIEEYHRIFPAKQIQVLKDAALPPAEDLLIDP